MASDRSKDLLSVAALVGGLLLSLSMAGAAVAVGFCGLFGDECTAEEEQTIGLLMLGAFVTFLAVPAAVAAVRRQARWLLAPVIEVLLIAALVGLSAVF